MSSPDAPTRPGGITFVLVLIWIVAVSNIVFGIWLLLSPLGQNPTITDITGKAYELPGFWLFANGLLTLLLGLIFVWLAKATAGGYAGAQVLIQVLAVINIVFGLFRLPYGWLALVLNVLVLILASGTSAKAWFVRTQ